MTLGEAVDVIADVGLGSIVADGLISFVGVGIWVGLGLQASEKLRRTITILESFGVNVFIMSNSFLNKVANWFLDTHRVINIQTIQV